jgi:ribose transport system ATP-binding protein
MIVGRELSGERVRLAPPRPEVALELDGIRAPGVDGVSLRLRRGEVLGIVGLVGAGQRALGQVIAGARPARAGMMLLGGAAYAPRTTRDALRRGVAFLPADRLREAGFPTSSTGANLWLRAGASGALLRHRAERSRAAAVLDEWAVTPSSPAAVFGALSGGNQQRVLLAKWVESGASVLVVDEPSAGVDVGARQAIHQRLVDAAAAGLATVLVSSDAEEVAELAHRALVLRDGRVACELAGDELNVKRITLECVRDDSTKGER